jgi:hypothetical protein
MNRGQRSVAGGLLSLLWLAAVPVAAEEPKAPSEAAAESRPEAKRGPQIHAYTTVTVLQDPTQAPRLPTTTAAVPAAPVTPQPPPSPPVKEGSSPRPTSDERTDVGRERARLETMRELRDELKEMRRSLRRDDRDHSGPRDVRPDGVRPGRDAQPPPGSDFQRERPFDSERPRAHHGDHRRPSSE